MSFFRTPYIRPVDARAEVERVVAAGKCIDHRIPAVTQLEKIGIAARAAVKMVIALAQYRSTSS
jgi:hypothetical protein